MQTHFAGHPHLGEGGKPHLKEAIEMQHENCNIAQEGQKIIKENITHKSQMEASEKEENWKKE